MKVGRLGLPNLPTVEQTEVGSSGLPDLTIVDQSEKRVASKRDGPRTHSSAPRMLPLKAMPHISARFVSLALAHRVKTGPRPDRWIPARGLDRTGQADQESCRPGGRW